MSVTHALHVFPVQLGIGEVLQKLLKLSQVDVFDNSVNIGVQDSLPVYPAYSLLEFKFRRQRHKTGCEELVS